MSEDPENVDQPDETSVTGRRLSRRTMIAGTAGAAAAMWAAPAVTSLGSRAFAQSPVSCQGVTDDCSNLAAHPCVPGGCFCIGGGCWFLLPFASSCTTDASCGSFDGLPLHCVQFCGRSSCFFTCADGQRLFG